ncbi:MAG: hydrogen gas-evolving membrane-bound hydrogenase subunit E [Planctomycetota bacterium]|jgi:multisubunit Na+/H+ antiporter MnhB subunit
MGVEYLIVALIIFMLLAALIAVETRDLLSSVICVGAAGFALSVVDLLVGAPDLAITQVVVEVIALVLLIRLVLTRDDTSVTQPRDALRTGAVLLAGGVILAAVFFAVGGVEGLQGRRAPGTMEEFGAPKIAEVAKDPEAMKQPEAPVAAKYLQRSASETGAANAVMAVLLDYRAYDTLGEATVIFVAILGAYVILRRVGRKHQELAP